MSKLNSGKHHDISTHELINQLSAIVGHCDLLKEDLAGDAKCLSHVRLIQEVAQAAAKQLKKAQCSVGPTKAMPATKGSSHPRTMH